jgi:hypothetical protein
LGNDKPFSLKMQILSKKIDVVTLSQGFAESKSALFFIGLQIWSQIIYFVLT